MDSKHNCPHGSETRPNAGKISGRLTLERLQKIMRSAGSGMRLSTVTARNFRCIRELSVELDDTTVLIGENNSGKTAFLEAIRISLEQFRGRSSVAFQAYDYHLRNENSAPADSDPIEIKLSFLEPSPGAWGDELIRELTDIVVLRGDGRNEVRFYLTSAFDRSTGESTVEWAFLDEQDNPLTGSSESAGQLMTLQRLAPVFYLSALRDASRHFEPSGHFWRTFLSDSSLSVNLRRELESELSDLNRRLIEVHGPLAEVRSKLDDVNKVIDFGSGDTVAIDALPTKLFSLLSRTQVSLASRGGPRSR